MTPKNFIKAFSSHEIFDQFNDSAIIDLLEKCDIVHLERNQILFNQGDTSRGLYFLSQGRLNAVLKDSSGNENIVGSIIPAEVVGELGVISLQPRTLSIISTEDSILYRLSKENFDLIISKQPQLLINITRLIVSRSQNLIKILSQNGNPSTNLFISMIDSENINDCKFKINEIMDESDKNLCTWHEFTEDSIMECEKRIKDSDNIYLIVDNDVSIKLQKQFIKKITTFFSDKNTIYLVLLQKSNLRIFKNTKLWLELYNFKQHYHLRNAHISDYQRFNRFISGRPVGLIAGGGGARGWVHVGAFRALYESKITIDAIGGVSIGSVVGTCYCISNDYQEFMHLIEDITSYLAKSFKLCQLTYPGVSLFSGHLLTKGIKNVFSNTRIEDLLLSNFIISCNLSQDTLKIHRTDAICQAIRASTALPGLVPPVVDNGDILVDGGLLNNLPVDIMRDDLGNNAKIITIDISNVTKDLNVYNFSTSMTFRKYLTNMFSSSKNKFVMPSMGNVMLTALLIASELNSVNNAKFSDILVHPELTGFGLLDSSRKDELIEIGYREMIKRLDEL